MMAELFMEKNTSQDDDNILHTSSEEESDDTSAWDSDPVTQRSKRQYYPVRGQPGGADQSGGSEGEQQADSNTEGEVPNDKMLRGDSEEDERRPEGGNMMSGGSVQAQLNGSRHQLNKYVDRRENDDDKDVSVSTETDEDGEDEKYSGQASSNGYHGNEEQYASEGWMDGGTREKQMGEEEDDIEEIDLTRDSLQPNYLGMNNGGRQFQQSRVMYLPSFGSLGPTSLSAVMGDLFGGAPSLDINGGDSGSDWAGKESLQDTEDGDGDDESQASREAKPTGEDENLVELFTTLKQQHEDQMKAQQDHHRKQLQWLKNQLLSGGKNGSFQDGTLNQEPATSSVRPHVQGASTEEGDSGDTQSHEIDTMHAAGQVNIEEVPLLDQAEDTSETSTYVSGSLDNTQMTTWSDVHDQKQGEGQRNSHQPVTTTEAAILQQMQRNFDLQQAALQQEYQTHVNRLQQEWMSQQQRQVHQRHLVEDMLQQQEDRLQQMAPSQKDVDETSSVYSDFTYWRLEEGETYKDLPNSKARRGQPSLEKDSLLSDEVHSPQITPRDEMVSPNHNGKASKGAKLVESPRTSSNRIDLQEKYSRHIADMEAYYEGELEDLRKQLAQAKLTSSVTRPDFGEELVGADASELYRHCQQLQANLTSANSRIQDLENTVKALETRLLEWPDRYTLANNTIEILQRRADDLLHLVKKREDDFKKLDRDNRKLQYTLLEAQEHQQSQMTEGKREQAMLSKLIAQYTQLTEQHDNTQADLLKVQLKLDDANLSISDLKRTAVRQELEIKQLEGEKKKLLDHHSDLRLMASPFPSKPLPSKPLPSKPLPSKPLLSSPRLPSSPHLQDRLGEIGSSVKEHSSVNSSLMSPSETRPKVSEGSSHHEAITPKSPSSVGDSLRLSVEDRKYLRSGADYNILTGQNPGQNPGQNTRQNPGQRTPIIDLSHEISTNSTIAQPDVISPIQTTTSPRDTLQASFDYDLGERPLSPMMKAAAQFDRWQSSGKSPRGQFKTSPLSAAEQRLGSSLNNMEIPVRDISTSQREENGDQLVLYKKRTRDSKSGGRKDRGKQSDGHVDNAGLRVTGASLLDKLDKEKSKPAKSASYKKASTIADIIQPGRNNDSSLHVWALHQSPDSALSSKARNSKASPRQQAVSVSPSQAARKNLAKYSVKDGAGGSERKKRTSPRRNLSASFQASEKKRTDGMNLRKGSEMSSKAVQTPSGGEDSLEAALQNVREGHVITRADWENGFAETKRAADKNAKRMTSKTAETPEAILKRLSKESKKLDDLMIEKRKLESSLSHLPNSGPANAKRIEQQEKLEERLDQVTRELGSVRMLLRKYNALNMSF